MPENKLLTQLDYSELSVSELWELQSHLESGWNRYWDKTPDMYFDDGIATELLIVLWEVEKAARYNTPVAE